MNNPSLPALPAALAQKLSRVLGMMGSDHDGEVLNAARMADRLVRDAGLTWGALFTPSAPSARWVEPKTAAAACAACLQTSVEWTEREHQFLCDLPRFADPSDKQLRWLMSLLDRARAAAGAEAPAEAPTPPPPPSPPKPNRPRPQRKPRSASRPKPTRPAATEMFDDPIPW